MSNEQRAGRLETWRAVVVAPGFGHLRAMMTLDAIEFFDPRDGWVWRASHRTTCWCGGAVHDAVATSAPAAVLVALASFCRVHDRVVEEVRGPGERTTAEQISEAVRREQEACAQVCDGVVAAENREGTRRRTDPALAAGASLCVDRAIGARDCAILIRDRAEMAAMLPVDAPPAWVPWPTSTGYWWHRTAPDVEPYVVEACGGPEEFWTYCTGNECATYAHERRDGWEFCPAEPPR